MRTAPLSPTRKVGCMSRRRHVLIAGCGYVGQRLALRLQADYDVTGLVRSAERVADLERLGIRALAID